MSSPRILAGCTLALLLAGCAPEPWTTEHQLLFESAGARHLTAAEPAAQGPSTQGPGPQWRTLGAGADALAALDLAEFGRASELRVSDARGEWMEVADALALEGQREYALRPEVEVQAAALGRLEGASVLPDGRLGAILRLSPGDGAARYDLAPAAEASEGFVIARRSGPEPGTLAWNAGPERGSVRVVGEAWTLLPLGLSGTPAARELELTADGAGFDLAAVLVRHPGGSAVLVRAGAPRPVVERALRAEPEPGTGAGPPRWRVAADFERRTAGVLLAREAFEFDVRARTNDRLRWSMANLTTQPAAGSLLERVPLHLRLPPPETLLRVLWRPDRGDELVLFKAPVHASWNSIELPLPPGLRGSGTLRFESLAGPGALAIERPELRPPVGSPMPVPAPQPRPNLLVILIDTLRADALGCLGSERPSSPRIDALAAEGVVFENFRAIASWTRPTVATLLTGAYPQWHGLGDGRPLPGELQTLGEAFSAAGYRTVAGTANVNVGATELGFDQGFDRFLDQAAFGDLLAATPEAPAPESSADRLHRRALRWLREFDGDAPWFALLHSVDPHGPYQLPAGAERPFSAAYAGPLRGQRLSATNLRRLSPGLTPADRAHVRAVYDEEVLHTDRAIGTLLDELERLGALENTVVVITSDHGEEFFEHGNWDHGYRMWEELLHVPLILWAPPRWRAELGLEPQRITAEASQVSFAPGLLELFGIEPSDPLPARGFGALIDGSAERLEPYYGTDGQAFEGTRVGALRDGSLKLIWNEDPATGFARERLFDLASDPSEQDDRSNADPAAVQRLLELRGAFERELLGWTPPAGLRPAAERGERVELGAAAKRQLEQLGYLEGTER